MIFLSSVLILSKEVAPKYQNIIKYDFSERCVDPLLNAKEVAQKCIFSDEDLPTTPATEDSHLF